MGVNKKPITAMLLIVVFWFVNVVNNSCMLSHLSEFNYNVGTLEFSVGRCSLPAISHEQSKTADEPYATPSQVKALGIVGRF